MSEQTEPAPPAPRKSSKLVVIVIALLVLAGGGGAGAYWFGLLPGSAAEAEEPKVVEWGLVSFEPFVVNLADDGGQRFLRTSVQLVVPDPAVAEHVQKTPVKLMQARSAILEILAQQNAATLVKPEGKVALKKAISERLKTVLDDVKVADVLFSDFVIQF